MATDGLFEPALDPGVFSSRGALVLSSDGVPATALGLGSRRLTALAIQAAQLSTGSIILVDEVEHALEPHRLRHLLYRLKKALDSERDGSDPESPAEAAEGNFGQVFLSTHSPVAVEELRVGDLHLVRRCTTRSTVIQVPEAFAEEARVDPQALVRGSAEALLGRRVVVCEGATEVGFFRELSRCWSSKRDSPVAHVGTVPVDGHGDTAPARAAGFAQLGYATALLIDSDKLKPYHLQVAQRAGVTIVQWEEECAIEERLALDLPEEGFVQMVQLGLNRLGEPVAEASILDMMNNYLPTDTPRLNGLDPRVWLRSPGLEAEQVRRAFGRTAHKKKCFKNVEGGEALGALAVQYFAEMAQKDVGRKIEALEVFAYGAS